MIPQPVLVTGGAGFIGRRLVRRLREMGVETVVVIDSFEAQVHGDSPLVPLHAIRMDCGDVWHVLDQVKACRSLVHLAAIVGVQQSMEMPAYYTLHNCYSTSRMLHSLGDFRDQWRIERLIAASSMATYGEGSCTCSSYRSHEDFLIPRRSNRLDQGLWEVYCACGAPCTHDPTDELWRQEPNSVYGLDKLYQERMALIMGRQLGIPTAALRLFNVYGAGQSLKNPYTGVLVNFARQLHQGVPSYVYEDGHQLRDFVHVSDVVSAIVMMLENEATGVYNIGTGIGTSINVVHEWLQELVGREGETVRGSYRSGDIRHCFADINRIRWLGWQPRVSLELGLSELVAWVGEELNRGR